MKSLLVAVFLVILATSESKDLFCWLCAGGSGSSFEDCNTRRKNQDCSKPEYQVKGENPLDRCAYFSYYSLKDRKRIYGKSCTVASFCTEDGKKFCENVGGGATQCQVECCPDEKCNDQEQFKVVKNWTEPTFLPTSSPTSSNPDDKYWCDWKETDSSSSVVSSALAFAACALAWMLVY